MILRTISAVSVKAILRKFLSILLHAAIACDLGDDAGSGDRERLRIALDDALVRVGKMFHRQAIDETMVHGDLVLFLQCADGSGHAMVGSAEDVERIDRRGIDLDLRPAHGGVIDERSKKQFAFFRGELFRVIEAL